MITLVKKTNKTNLIHITTKSCVDSILKNGIVASEYGDLEVNGNDGYGVYAIKSINSHPDLIEELAFSKEPLYAVIFSNPAEWYECTDETRQENDEEDNAFVPFHIGYIVLPYNIDKQFIKKLYLL